MKKTQLKQNLKWIILPAAFAAMGIAMPSCPGQQEMQQKIDSIQTANSDLSKKVQALNAQINTLNNDMNQVKQILPQMSSLLAGQKDAQERLENAVKEIQAKTSKGASKKKK